MSGKMSAIDFLLSIPMFQQVGASALNPSLDKITEFDAFLGSPHKKYKTIHVGGTNGKGSVSHMLCSVLMSAGYKVGLYTSPHLKAFNERIRVNGQEIEDDYIEVFVEKTRSLIESVHPSFFEVTTALAFNYFADRDVDIAVIEVGLGGNFDATNIISPVLSVITNISKDHTAILGNSVAEIAKQKAGIIKSGVPVVIGETDSESEGVFTECAAEKEAEVCFADQVFSLKGSEIIGNYRFFEISGKFNQNMSLICELIGEAQKKNVLTVCAVVDILKNQLSISLNALQKGLENCVSSTSLKGRWQTLQNLPLVVCDTAHNKAGIEEVVSQLSKFKYDKLFIVLGMVSDKDVNAVLSLFPKEAYYIFTKAQIGRALDEKELSKLGEKYGLCGETQKTVTEALGRAKSLANNGDIVFVGGSNFVVAEVV